MKISKLLLSPLLITAFSLLLPSGVFSQTDIAVTTDEKRNKLIGYMLSKQLPSIHFSDKQVNDKLAEAIFDLYLKQLDFQKRFLIKDDADRLRSFPGPIDDPLLSGTIVLPKVGYDIMVERIGQAETCRGRGRGTYCRGRRKLCGPRPGGTPPRARAHPGSSGHRTCNEHLPLPCVAES